MPHVISYKKYLSGLLVAAFVSWAAWFLVVAKLNPFESTLLALSLFFVSLLFALVCTFTLIGFYMRAFLNAQEVHQQHISISLRQAILLAVCADVCLLLLVFGLLTWWSGFLLVIVITLIEFYFTREE